MPGDAHCRQLGPRHPWVTVSILVTFFAGITQGLNSAGFVGLSTTQMVRIWLVSAGLVVLLAIADMICRAYVTAKTYGFGEASVAGLNLLGHSDTAGTAAAGQSRS